jgi:hypothetical protein
MELWRVNVEFTNCIGTQCWGRRSPRLCAESAQSNICFKITMQDVERDSKKRNIIPKK